MNPTLTRSGKRSWDSINGPKVLTGAASQLSITRMAWGLPIDSAPIDKLCP